MKTLYVFENGMDTEYYDSEIEALMAARYAWDHLTVRERNSLNYFMVYEIAVEEDEPIPFDGDPLGLATRKIIDIKQDHMGIRLSQQVDAIKKLKEVKIEVIDNLLQEARNHAIKDINMAMYHECFEVSHSEDGLQKWDGGNWIRYKLFEDVMEKISKGE